MSTTIDSLEIKIQSDSSRAAEGIEELAIALGDLKNSGKIGSTVKKLNELTAALKNLTAVTSNISTLTTLASSISTLSKAGSLTRVINQLNKLPTALRGLSSINVDGSLGAKVGGLATALAPLSQIKTGGFSTMVNSLSKIATVTESLDDGTITRFTERIRKLNEALTPLSTKMTTIQAGLRGLNTSARSAGDGMGRFGTKINTTTLNLASLVTAIQGAMWVIMPLVRLLSSTISEALEWDGIAARFGRGFGDQAQEVYTWIQRLNKEMGINTQQFMQYSSTYATMLSGFGVASEDASKMALGYMELTYDVWAGYNDVYKSLDDAATAIRSAIAGEVEPVRKAGFSIIESTMEKTAVEKVQEMLAATGDENILAQTAANHGLKISLESATEAQKSYLRYLTLTDQAYAQGLVGTYAAEMNTAEGVVRTFSQQLKSLAQSFGSLFLPVLVKVIPWLQALVDLLTEGIVLLAGFFGIEIQPVSWSSGTSALEDIGGAADTAADSLDNTTGAAGSAKKAIEDLKRATVGIDELNVISPLKENESSGGGGGGGSSGSNNSLLEDLDVDSLWDESIFDQVQSKVKELKGKIKGFFDEWETQIKIIGAALGALAITKLLSHLGQALGLGDKFLGLMGTLGKLAVTGIIITLQYTLMTEFFDKYIDGEGFKEYIKSLFVGAISTYVLYSRWGTTGLIIGLSVIAAASLKAVIDNGGINSTESAVTALTGLAGAAGAVGLAVKKLSPIIANSNLGAFLALLKEGNGFLPSLAVWFPKLSGAIGGAAEAVGTFVGGLSAGTLGLIAAGVVAVASAAYFLYENWEEVVATVKRFFQENIVPKLDSIKESWEKIKECLAPLAPIIEKIGEFFKPVVEWVKKAADAVGDFFKKFDLWDGVKKVIEVIGGVVFGVFSGTIAGAISAVVTIIEGFVQAISGIVQIVSGVVEALVKLFSGDLQGAWDAVKKIGKGIVDVFVGLYKAVVAPIGEFFDGVTAWFIKLWDELVGHSIVPDTINAIVEWFTSLPSKIFGSVQNFVTGIVDRFKNLGADLSAKFSSAWSAVKNWWANKKTLEVPKIGVSLVKKGWTTVAKWIGSIPVVNQAIGLAKKGWSTVKGWIGSIPAVSQAVSLAKKGWSSVKKWVGTMPTLSAGIKLVKSGWTTVKKWLGSLNFDIGFKLPKIGVNWSTKEVLGFKIKYPSSFYTYAKGGFPDMGEMFIARENGLPEMVGRIGSKTTVANNDQIVEGISEGVYAAVLAAMSQSESNGTQAVNVYLDGRQITSSVEQHRKERGASIMGNQVYAY
jgi:hypothetical protein